MGLERDGGGLDGVAGGGVGWGQGCGGEADRVKIKDCVKIERVFFAIVAFPD